MDFKFRYFFIQLVCVELFKIAYKGLELEQEYIAAAIQISDLSQG